MRIQAPPASAVANAVWAVASRTLTADPVTRTAVTGSQVVASGATLDLRPAGTAKRILFVASSVIGGSNFGTYDGATFNGANNPATIGYAVMMLCGVAAVGPAFKNTSGGNITVTWCGWDEG